MLNSCYPGDPISASDTDVVTTFYSPNADFAGKTTYAMPDSVIYITDSGMTSGGNSTLNNQILTAINNNMQNFGFVAEPDPDAADVHIVALAAKTTWVGGSCYPGYWGGYWYPYSGWCYPVAYSYETGTLLIVMLDPTTSTSDNAQPIWLAGMNGLLSGSANVSRINKAINQAFDQSADYLKK